MRDHCYGWSDVAWRRSRRLGRGVLVNDRVDVALAAGAHGVHLRSDSPSASRVRTIVPGGFLIGRSIHGKADAERATSDGGVDYLMLGTCFPSASKPGRDASGVAALAETVTATPVPVLAVGGVTLERLEQVRNAGAAGFAAIGLFDAPPAALPLILARSFEAFGPGDTLPGPTSAPGRVGRGQS
jgi:thiamine-phosphate diphosphorylase